MTYEAITLKLSKEESRKKIADAVSNINTQESDGAIEYRTHSGLLLAVLSDTTLATGERGSRLRYRTAIVTPTLSHGRRKAAEIRQAVSDYQV